MIVTELDTFVKKFYQLWNAGQVAHLDVDSNAGNAWVGLRVQLGHAPGPLHQQLHPTYKKSDCPSRQRRRARRAAARAEEVNAEEATTTTTAETFIEETEVSTEEVEVAAEAATDKIDIVVPAAEEASSDQVKCDQCELTFRNTRGLKTHKGRVHKMIQQLDGFEEEPDNDYEYTFESNYGEEDILYTLEELNIVSKLVSRVKIGSDRSANRLCTVIVSIPRDGWQWPGMNGLQREVIKNLKSIPSC